jgi:hypothetical protein
MRRRSAVDRSQTFERLACAIRPDEGGIKVTLPDEIRRTHLKAAFRMPSAQTPVSRKSTITNAFVSAIIPTIVPTLDEIEQALNILGVDPSDVRCAYCGDKASEWDHLRPLVWKRRPTGFITEIGNLVPSCAKCNQSKGNANWREWMHSKANRSPTGRGIVDIANRVARLELYEKWRPPTRIQFESTLRPEEWEEYWQLCENVVAELKRCQEIADSIRSRITQAISKSSSNS